VSHLSSFHTFIFSGGVDGTIKKSELIHGTHSYEFKGSVKLDGHPIAMVAGNDKILYVLQNNNQLALIEIEGFTVVKTHDFKDYEATALTTTENEIWVGDKKGVIHILNSNDLSEKALIEKKHNHPLSYMTTSRDGKLVATGDSYRYIYVFNADSKAEVNCFTYHTARITHLNFNKDGTLLLTASLDLGVGVAKLADKTKKIIHRTNDKELTSVTFDNEDRFFTSGYDCAIRLWSQ
jgi:WD40 repeat protein